MSTVFYYAGNVFAQSLAQAQVFFLQRVLNFLLPSIFGMCHVQRVRNMACKVYTVFLQSFFLESFALCFCFVLYCSKHAAIGIQVSRLHSIRGPPNSFLACDSLGQFSHDTRLFPRPRISVQKNAFVFYKTYATL